MKDQDFPFFWEIKGRQSWERGKRWRIMSENRILTLIQAEMWKILIRFKRVFKRFRLRHIHEAFAWFLKSIPIICDGFVKGKNPNASSKLEIPFLKLSPFATSVEATD